MPAEILLEAVSHSTVRISGLQSHFSSMMSQQKHFKNIYNNEGTQELYRWPSRIFSSSPRARCVHVASVPVPTMNGSKLMMNLYASPISYRGCEWALFQREDCCLILQESNAYVLFSNSILFDMPH